MNIDWFTVGAQVLNFLILVWLMKRFLYKPIMGAIDTREKKIAKELADADTKKAEAQKEHEEFLQKNDEFDKQHDALMNKAKDDVKAERSRLLDEARQEANTLSAKRKETLINDAHNLNQEIINKTQKEVFAIVRKLMSDLSTETLEASMTEVFINRLKNIQGKSKDELSLALKTASDPVTLRSSFDLPAQQQKAIKDVIDSTFSTKSKIDFETAPELINGIELTANGYKVAWNINDYLFSFEKSIGELLKKQDKPIIKTKSETDKPALPNKGVVKDGD